MAIQASLKELTPTAKRLIDKLLVGDLLWMPHPQNASQVQAYCSEADVIYYGGAAGGGKSDLLIGLALTDHKKSIIFRREYKQLRELVERTRELLGDTPASFSQTLMRWRDIPGDRQLEFGAVQREEDKENFKGRPHDFIGFDEIPDFTESQFRFLMAWNRTTDPNQRVRVVCAGNPPTDPEGRWVIKYWAPWLEKNHPNRAESGELRYFAAIDGKDVEIPDGEPFTHRGETIYPRSRTFIPAFLRDNPYFNGTGYYSQLQALPEPLRSQLLNGDFFIEEEPQIRQVIPTAWVREAQNRWRKDDDRARHSATHVGLDPSRGGKDQTVLAPRVGTYFKELITFEGYEVPDGEVCATLTEQTLGPDFEGVILIDVIGIGTSAYEALMNTSLQVVDINFAAKSIATDRSGTYKMRNIRSEAYWGLREALDPKKGDDLALPHDEELVADLTAPRWKRTSAGILIESKKDIRKRLGRSPGKGDALALAYLDYSPGVLFA